MFTVSSTETVCTTHTLKNHKGKCRNLHGHNYIINVELKSSTLDSEGMVMDFGDIKEQLMKLDHAFLCNINNPVDSEFASLCKTHGMKTFFVDFNTTAEELSKFLSDVFIRLLAGKFKNVNGTKLESRVSIYETQKHCATYESKYTINAQ